MLYLALFGPKQKYEIGMLVGKPVPEFSLKYMEDIGQFSNIDLHNSSDSYKIINFFASWCTTCVLEHPDLLKLTKRQDIEVVGIAWRDSKKAATDWLDEHGNQYDILLNDKAGGSKFKFGLIGVPESFLIDSNNNIIAHYRGPIDLKQINDFLDAKIELIQ